MANTTLTTFTGTMAKFLDEVDALKIGAETQKVTITNAAYTIADLSAIKTAATKATIVLQAAANPQLEGDVAGLTAALTDIKYSGAITVSEALDNTTLAGVLALTTGKVTADVSGTAADLVEALEAETTVNALTVTVANGATTAADLKILDAKTSVTVDASAVAAITGTAAELKTVLAAKTITLDTTAVAVTVDGKVSAADLNTIAKATAGVVTAEVEGSAAALNAALKEVSANNITVILTGTTATAKDLKELATKTSLPIDASGIETITGNAADVTKVLTDNNTLAANVATTVTGTVTIAEIIAIKALATTGVIKATLEGSAAELATLTTSNSDLLTLKVTGTTATATELNDIDAATSVKVNASAIKDISGAAADLKTMYASKTISGLGNEAVTINGTPSAKDVNAILKATSGIVTASVTGAAADLVKDLTDAKATDKLTLTVSAGTATAAELKALDAKTSVAVDARLVTEITGNAADVKTVLKAEGITLDKVTTGAVAVTVTGTVSAADANTIAKATDGKVTATVAAGTAASLKAALTDVTAADALKLKVTGTATVADLLALDGKTSIPVDAKSVTAITGTAAEFVELAKNTTHVDLSSTVAVTVIGVIDVAALNTIAGETFGKVTATVEGSANDLKALTTASTDAITVKVTGATATAADLIAIDKATSVVVDAKAVKTITAAAAEVADVTTVLAAKTIAKAADVAVTISDANTNDITALQANSIAKLTTGVVTATVADGSASYLNSTLKDAKATDALTLKVIGTTATAADLNALDAKTKEVITVEATKIEGTLADLNKIFVDVVTSTHFVTTSTNIKNVNITDKTVTANDVNKIAEATDAAVKATVTADSAANLVDALEDTDNDDALTLTVNGTTAKAFDLVTLKDKTSVDVTVNATEVTGNYAQLESVYVTDKADFLALGNENIVIDGTTITTQLDTIANATTGKVTATLDATTAISDATVTALTHVNGTTDVISFTAATTTADATALVALAAKVITADATAFAGVTAITEATANIGTNGAAVVSALNIAGNDVTVDFTDVGTAISAASADAIADATSGVVTATITAGTAAALNAALVDAKLGAAVNAYTLTVNDSGSVKATDLTGLDAKTSVNVIVNASVTDITGSSAEVAAVYAAKAGGTITNLGEETVHITGVDATVANVATINSATTGLVTVSEVDVTGATFSLADLGALTEITGLKTIDATNTAASALNLTFADLFAANDTANNLAANIAVKLGAGDTLNLDAGWTQTSGTAGNGTYVHANGEAVYTVTVTGADNAGAVILA